MLALLFWTVFCLVIIGLLIELTVKAAVVAAKIAFTAILIFVIVAYLFVFFL